MDRPKISIISPSFNQGKYIEDAILSVLEQNYDSFEHIIIDGGSTDNTIEILNKYSHLKWISEKDNGQSHAINKGFDLAKGEIIGWLNTDDYYLPETFNTVLRSFQDIDADAVYGDVMFVNAKKDYLRTVKSHKPIKWLALFHCYIHSASFFFKRRMLEDGVRVDQSKEICMDKDLFANMLHRGYKFQYVPKIMTCFRWHDENKSIDSYKVKKIRINEGIDILNKYSKIRIKKNILNKIVYYLAMKVLLPFRKTLKMIN